MIKPTIGRKLWYWETRQCFEEAALVNFDHETGPQPQDASVCYVFSDRCVNLSVVDHNGTPRSVTSVVLMQEGDAIPDGRFATWMPYQIGQAKRESADRPRLASTV